MKYLVLFVFCLSLKAVVFRLDQPETFDGEITKPGFISKPFQNITLSNMMDGGDPLDSSTPLDLVTSLDILTSSKEPPFVSFKGKKYYISDETLIMIRKANSALQDFEKGYRALFKPGFALDKTKKVPLLLLFKTMMQAASLFNRGVAFVHRATLVDGVQIENGMFNQFYQELFAESFQCFQGMMRTVFSARLRTSKGFKMTYPYGQFDAGEGFDMFYYWDPNGLVLVDSKRSSEEQMVKIYTGEMPAGAMRRFVVKMGRL